MFILYDISLENVIFRVQTVFVLEVGSSSIKLRYARLVGGNSLLYSGVKQGCHLGQGLSSYLLPFVKYRWVGRVIVDLFPKVSGKGP